MLGMTNLVFNHHDGLTDFTFIKVDEEIKNPNNSYCFGNMRASKKLDIDDQFIVKKLFEAKETSAQYNKLKTYKSQLQDGLNFFIPDGQLDQRIKTMSNQNISLEYLLHSHFPDGDINQADVKPIDKIGLKDALAMYSPNGELIKQDDIPAFRLTC